jgi:hypothetical protein
MTNLEPPTISEVIRRLDDLKSDVHDLGKRVVSSEIYAIDKANLDKEIADLRAQVVAETAAREAARLASKSEIDLVRQKHEADEKARDKEIDDARKESKRLRIQFGTAAAIAVLGWALPQAVEFFQRLEGVVP